MWNLFGPHEIRQAHIHADKGGIAVQYTGVQHRGENRARLLARDEQTLLQVGLALGLQERWMQGPGRIIARPTFELFGAPLEQAITLCNGAAPPAAAPLRPAAAPLPPVVAANERGRVAEWWR